MSLLDSGGVTVSERRKNFHDLLTWDPPLLLGDKRHGFFEPKHVCGRMPRAPIALDPRFPNRCPDPKKRRGSVGEIAPLQDESPTNTSKTP